MFWLFLFGAFGIFCNYRKSVPHGMPMAPLAMATWSETAFPMPPWPTWSETGFLPWPHCTYPTSPLGVRWFESSFCQITSLPTFSPDLRSGGSGSVAGEHRFLGTLSKSSFCSPQLSKENNGKVHNRTAQKQSGETNCFGFSIFSATPPAEYRRPLFFYWNIDIHNHKKKQDDQEI